MTVVIAHTTTSTTEYINKLYALFMHCKCIEIHSPIVDIESCSVVCCFFVRVVIPVHQFMHCMHVRRCCLIGVSKQTILHSFVVRVVIYTAPDRHIHMSVRQT